MTNRLRQSTCRFISLVGLLAIANACTTQNALTTSDKTRSHQGSQLELLVGEKFIDAFYSWQPHALAQIVNATEDQDRALYYQAWAEAGNYKIKTRTPCTMSGERVSCAITVTDDIGAALGYIATDTFLLDVEADKVAAVEFTSDDPPIFNALFEWMGEDRPQVFSGPCKDLFDGGDTPAACVRAVVKAAREFQQPSIKRHLQ